MKVLSDWTQKPIYDVIAKIRGTQEPERWIIRGNHHDAWVFGATDPMSGQVALMAEAKAIGKLVQEGWRPRRTLVYASWDGEEPGLLGSTEWVEAHARELEAKAVLYVNSDTNGRGFLDVEGTHALQHSINEIADDVKDPETGATVRTRAGAARRSSAYESGRIAENGEDVLLGALGSGSDYTPFLQHLGVSSLNVEFRGEAEYGVYHSAYDSFDHFRRFVDPNFEYGTALARVAGRIALRAAQADLLPARESDFAASVAGYDEELHKLVDNDRDKSRRLDKLLDEGAFQLAQNPRLPRAPPVRSTPVPDVSFVELDAAIERLKTSAKAFDAEYQRLAASGAGDDAGRRRMNAALSNLETALTDPEGLPGREWYRHMMYAPGLQTGYGVKTMPGIREAIEEQRWDQAAKYMGVVARVLNAYSDRLDRAIGGGGSSLPR
jgi:N-acetylated-alpha-linked acidic dipeptidase